MGSPTSTQGTDRVVKSITVGLGVGAEQEILPAKAGVLFRVVDVQASLDAAGDIAIYYGADSNDATKYIARSYLASRTPLVVPFGDWAPQNAAPNENIQANVTGGNALIVLTYIEISQQQ